MPLVLYKGPEGAGKSALMTWELLFHHNCGGKVYAFPGYELLGPRGKVLSELLMPEQCLQLINEEESGYAIAIDEINNFFNHHRWQGIMNDILTSLMTQRRKRSLALLATVTTDRLVSLDIRSMFHIIFDCKDYHAISKDCPRGIKTFYTEEDARGLISGNIGTMTKGRIFNHKKSGIWKRYNSFALIDPKYITKKVKVHQEAVLVDGRGNAIDEGVPAHQLSYTPQIRKTDRFMPAVQEVAKMIVEKEGMAIQAVRDILQGQGFNIPSTLLGRLLRQCGVGPNWRNYTYVPLDY